MVKEVKQFSSNTKRKVSQAYEALAIVVGILGSAKLATLPYEYGLPLWQIAAAVIVTGILAKLYTLLIKE